MRNRLRFWVTGFTTIVALALTFFLVSTQEMGLATTFFLGLSAFSMVLAVWWWYRSPDTPKEDVPESDKEYAKTTNSVSGSTSGGIVQARTISGGVTSNYFGPVFIGSFAALNDLRGRRTLAIVAALVFGPDDPASAGPDTQQASEPDPGGGTEVTDAEGVSEIHCPLSGREAATMEAPSPASVTLSPFLCLPTRGRAPSFVFPREEAPPVLGDLGSGQAGALDSWAREQGYGGYSEWAYAHGGVDADVSGVDFAVGSDSEQAVDIMMVELSVLSTSEPMKGYYLPPPGAGPTDLRVLRFDLDDPHAPPRRYNSDHETGAEWNFPLSVRNVPGDDESDMREMFSVFASTSRSTVEWTLIVHLLVDNEPQLVVVDDGGEPFVTTSSSGSEEIGFFVAE